MASWPKISTSWITTLLLFVFLCHTVISSRVIIDPASCRTPSQRDPTINFQTVQDILDEAFVMAKAVKDSLAQAAADPGSISGRRVDYILENMLAVNLKDKFFPDVQEFFDLVLARQAGTPPDDLTIYCNEDFRIKKTFMNSLPFFGRPKQQGYCEQMGGNAYTEKDENIVLCQSFWAKYYYSSKQVVGNDFKTDDLTGTYMDQLETASGAMLHELLHSANYGAITRGGRSYYSVVDISIEVRDTPDASPRVIEGYGFTNCKLIALASAAAQREAGDDTSATDAVLFDAITSNPTGSIPSTTPGAAYLCADNLRLFALQIYLIKNDFVGTGRGQNFNPDGFNLPS